MLYFAVWASILVLAVLYLARSKFPARGKSVAILGSGGHTGELLAILLGAELRGLNFIYSRGDALSVTKCQAAGFSDAQFYELPRARDVGESKISSAFSVCRSLIAALVLIWQLKPKMVICNGPGICVVVVAACRLFRLRSRVIYIESLARVQSLSMAGTILYKMNWADKFLVQWPELARKYNGTEYLGCLV